MDILNDELLIEAYFKAKSLNLDKDFIKVLKIELQKRSIDIQENKD